jgi:hypothetical protein
MAEDRIFFKVTIVTFLVIFLICKYDIAICETAIPDSLKKSLKLFKMDEIMEISLRFDLSTFLRTRPKKDYLNSNITFHLSETDSICKDIRLRSRGAFRNQYCSFPPIELNFKKVDFGYTDLNRISKLKLVPQCSSGKQNEDYVLREYLAYKLFNVMTDTSFRVRLLRVNYIDTKKKRKTIMQYGFFIEPAEMLASRTNSLQIKPRAITQKNIFPKVMDRLAIFNYMIGNYDWAVPNQHNIVILKPLVYESLGLALAIPYDFDWTGLVNASYAIPAEVVGTQNVRERLFLGVCRSKAVYQEDLEIFLKKKDEFYRVINEFPYLDKNAKKDMILYLDEFYDKLEGRRDLIIDILLNSCKNF